MIPKFNTLLPYEFILLVAGCILFVVAIVMLVISMVKGKPKAITVIPFFFITIIMVGFPAIQSFSYVDGKIDVNLKSQAVEKNPNDTVARQNLEKAISKLDKSRVDIDTGGAYALAKGYRALGKYDTAIAFVQKALKNDPNYTAANTLNAEIKQDVITQNTFAQKTQEINTVLTQIQEKNTTPSKEDLDKISTLVADVKTPTYTTESSSAIFSKALAITNQRQEAVKYLDKVVSLRQHNVAITASLKDSIQTDKLNNGIYNRSYRPVMTFKAK